MTTRDSNLGQSESEVYSISPFLCCFVHPSTAYLFIHPSIHFPFHPPIYSGFYPSHPAIQLFTHPVTHPSIHAATRVSTQPLTDHSFTLPPTHLPVHSPIRPLKHPPTHPPSKHLQNSHVCQTPFLPWWRLQASGGGVRKQLG